MTVTSSIVCGRSHPYIMSPKMSPKPCWRRIAFPDSGKVLRCGFAGVALCRLLVCWPRCISRVTFPRLRRRTLIFMTALAVISALVTALCIGYHFGRRAGSTPSTWRKRTSRVALSKLAVSLLVLMTVRRIRQSFLAERVLPDAGGVWGMKFVEPLQLLRGSFARLRL
jgi:hypothetical protein